MLLAQGKLLGDTKIKFLKDRDLLVFVNPAKELLRDYAEKIEVPLDLAFEKAGKRQEISIAELPADELYMDIGEKTIERYETIIHQAGTIFVNGPARYTENPLFAEWNQQDLECNSQFFRILGYRWWRHGQCSYRLH